MKLIIKGERSFMFLEILHTESATIEEGLQKWLAKHNETRDHKSIKAKFILAWENYGDRGYFLIDESDNCIAEITVFVLHQLSDHWQGDGYWKKTN